MKSRFYSIILFLILIIASGDDLYAQRRRMLGANVNMSWASSYLTIDSTSVKVENNASWTYASAVGWFFDYMTTPHISFRSEWFFYPAAINSAPGEMKEHIGEMPLHEIGFSILKHYNFKPINPWVGAGPYMQFSTINDVNSYILHGMISFGCDYEFLDDTFFCPEFMCGIGVRIISSNSNTVQIDVPTGKDFTTSGIILIAKLGVAKSF